jgi:hypothetical protein
MCRYCVKNVNDHIQIAERLAGLKKPNHKVRSSGPSVADSLRILETLRKSDEDRAKATNPTKLGHTPIPS